MRTTLTAQQNSFFTKNGYIELGGIDFEGQELFSSLVPHGHSQWQHSSYIRTLLMKKLGPIALALSGKNSLRIAADWHIAAGNAPKKKGVCNELFSIQGLQIGCLIAKESFDLPAAPLGILPLPSQAGHVLFFRTNLILDWMSCPAVDLYLAAFALPNAVYVENKTDPSGHDLKKQGYAYGDTLKNETHPLISQKLF